jgi:hypothetical protein
MATRPKLNWKLLDRLLPLFEQEGWSHAQIADDWAISLTTLERHLTQEVSMSAISKHDYPALFEEYDQRLASGEPPKAIRATFESRGIVWGTFQNRRTQWHKAHRGTPTAHQDRPEDPELWTVHPSTPADQGTPERPESLPDEQYTQEHPDTPSNADPTEAHPGTLEGHQEVMEEVHQSVPDVPHISTDEVHQSTPEHPSTPEVRPDMSLSRSSMEHFGVPARQDQLISTPMVHPGTPTADDWELWTTIKARWLEVEKMLADRQVLLSTPLGTPGHTQKKTYVFDVQHIALIDRYAQDHRLDLKDVLYTALQEFFERRGYVDERSQQP